MSVKQQMVEAGTATSAFGGLLRRHRESLALSQEDLADASGVAARTISDLERGVAQRPRSATVRLLAAGLGLSGAELETFKAAARAWRRGVPGVPGETVGPVAMPRAAQLVAGLLPDGQVFCLVLITSRQAPGPRAPQRRHRP
jgi:transcriptional regulator with XRE-family HTH domain